MSLTPSAFKLKKGSSALAFKGLPCATCGKKHSLSDFQGSKALLVVFMCNHCPYVKMKLDSLRSLHEKFASKGLAMVGINVNDTDEFPEDDFPSMQRMVREDKLGFHYVFDSSQKTAHDYGATCTPDPFLFDSSFKLAYHGRIDDAFEPGTKAKTHDMADAIEALLAGKAPKEEFIASIGCSIKWKVK